MYMAEKLDAGDILTQAEVVIEEEDNVGTMHDKLSQVGADLLADTIPKLLKGELTPTKQDETKATFASNIRRSDEKIDWTKTGEEIYNHVRGTESMACFLHLVRRKGLKIMANKKGDRIQKSGARNDYRCTRRRIRCGNGK